MKLRPIFPVVQTQSHPGHLIQISQVCDSLQVSLLRHLEEKGGYESYKEFAGLNLAHIISLSHNIFTSLLVLPLLLSSKKEKKEYQSYTVTDIKSCVAQMDIAGLSLAASYQNSVSFTSSHNFLSSLLSLKAVTHQSDIKELVATKATLLSAHVVWNKKVPNLPTSMYVLHLHEKKSLCPPAGVSGLYLSFWKGKLKLGLRIYKPLTSSTFLLFWIWIMSITFFIPDSHVIVS